MALEEPLAAETHRKAAALLGVAAGAELEPITVLLVSDQEDQPELAAHLSLAVVVAVAGTVFLEQIIRKALGQLEEQLLARLLVAAVQAEQ